MKKIITILGVFLISAVSGGFFNPPLFFDSTPWRTVFSTTLTTDGTGAAGYSYRELLDVSLGGLASTQIRVTVTGSASASTSVNNFSVGIPNTAPNTTGITQLLVGGASGWSTSAGGSKVSDPLSFSLSGSETQLIIVNDEGSGGNYRYTLSTGTLYYKAASASYNQNSVSGYSSAGQNRYVTKIEVR